MSQSLVNRRHRGVSLVEISITAALVAILVGSALPSLHGMLMQRAMSGRSAELVTDLQYLRSEALARNQSLRISIQGSKAGSCYVLHTGPAKACDCLSPQGASCSGDAQSIKSVFLPAGAAVQFDANVNSMLFDPVHGTSTPAGRVQVLDTRGHVVRHVVNSLGRVTSCTPQSPVAGYAAC